MCAAVGIQGPVKRRVWGHCVRPRSRASCPGSPRVRWECEAGSRACVAPREVTRCLLSAWGARGGGCRLARDRFTVAGVFLGWGRGVRNRAELGGFCPVSWGEAEVRGSRRLRWG